MPLTAEDVAAIETVAHYTHDEDQCYLMLYGEGVFDTIPIEADYTVGDMKLWLKTHKDKDPNEYDLVGAGVTALSVVGDLVEKAVAKAGELNEEYNLTEKAKESLAKAVDTAKEKAAK